MKVLLALHGYPQELAGGTEHAAAALAQGLRAAGDEVAVCAGSLAVSSSGEVEVVREEVDGVPVARVRRPDLYFDHWQKSAHAGVGRAFEALLDELRPDVVHVHHWIRLTRDLVARAARRGIPAVLSLHDLWTTCLVTFRVHTRTREFCQAPLGPSPCLDCAAALPPRTPWVDAAQARMALAQRGQDVARELELARVVIAPCASHARAVERWLGRPDGALPVRAVPPAREVELPRRPPLPRAPGDPLVLASWGNRTALKGFDLLLAAARRLRDPSSVRLLFAGGAVDEAYEARLDELGEGLAVERMPAFERVEELATHPVAAAHLMVSGSRAHESWGLVLDEALALGLPSVLPDAGAFRERATGAGWASLYAPNDADDLARVLQELVDDPARLDALRAALPPAEEASPRLADAVAQHRAAYAEAARAGAPEVPAADWWADRMQTEEVRRWDEALGRCSAAELGLGEAGG